MKRFIFIISILNTTILFAQLKMKPVLEVKYNIHYNTEIPNIKKGTLLIDETLNKSLFVYGKNKKAKIVKKDNENRLSVQFGESVRFNYVDFISDSIYSMEKVMNEEFIIYEKKSDLKWKLINENKKIDTLLVKKASLNFRGRNYTAWYSDKYPIKFGPWKFYNLPGLILEIYDESKRYHWVMTSISKKEFNKNFNYLIKDEVKKISLEEFEEIRYYKDLKLINESRLPRGTSINKKRIKRNGIEIKFEWEENTEEN